MTTEMLTKLESVLTDPRGYWSSKECATSPAVLDKVMHYLVGYTTNHATARKAVRIFRGIDRTESVQFESWNEVRISTLKDIQTALKQAGATCDTWELAITIKDFLQNVFDTLGFCDIDDSISDKELNAFIEQLQGKPNSWEKNAITPFRPNYSTWNRKNARIVGETVLPEPVLMYVRFALNRTKYAPFEYHSEKVLGRVGLFPPEADYATKRKIYNDMIGLETPISKHRRLVEFSKLVCLERQPRCGICPLKTNCQFFASGANLS